MPVSSAKRPSDALHKKSITHATASLSVDRRRGPPHNPVTEALTVGIKLLLRRRLA